MCLVCQLICHFYEVKSNNKYSMEQCLRRNLMNQNQMKPWHNVKQQTSATQLRIILMSLLSNTLFHDNDSTWKNVYKKNNILFTVKFTYFVDKNQSQIGRNWCYQSRCSCSWNYTVFSVANFSFFWSNSQCFCRKGDRKTFQHSVRSIENDR